LVQSANHGEGRSWNEDETGPAGRPAARLRAACVPSRGYAENCNQSLNFVSTSYHFLSRRPSAAAAGGGSLVLVAASTTSSTGFSLLISVQRNLKKRFTRSCTHHLRNTTCTSVHMYYLDHDLLVDVPNQEKHKSIGRLLLLSCLLQASG